MADKSEDAPQPARRGFLKSLITLSAGSIAAITIVPCLQFFAAVGLSPAKRKQKKVLFARPEDAKSATFVAARYEGQEDTAPGIFFRMDGGKPVIFSARCTHASCAVNWVPAENCFLCPCHQGKFDASGKNIAGPPPAPLDILTASVSNGDLFVMEPEA